MIKEKIEDLVPIVFGTIVQNKGNPSGPVNKARNKNVKILLDSGASASIIHHSYVRKNDFTQDKIFINGPRWLGHLRLREPRRSN